MLAQNDNRLFERVSGELAVRYSPRGTDGEFCSTTRNISGGGIRMPLLKKVKPLTGHHGSYFTFKRQPSFILTTLTTSEGTPLRYNRARPLINM